MSGRDLRAFLSGHRSGTFHTSKNSGEQQVQKYCAGTAPRMPKVDYDELLSDVKRRKDESVTGLQRFKHLTKKGKEAKETSLLKKHHEVWMKEKTRLTSLKSRTQSELSQWRSKVITSDPELVSELIMCESELYEERAEFEELTLSPVWLLRTDLKSLLEDRGSFPEADQTPPSSSLCQIREELECVKEQQAVIQCLLREECELLERDLDGFVDEWGLSCHSNFLVVKEINSVPRGVPPEVECLECPDERLRGDSLNEFVRLDEQYSALLDQWRRTNAQTLDVPYGGWERDEAEHFSHLLDQYSPSLPHRRTLYIDRALREFPHKTRAEIVTQESWFLSFHHYQSVRNNLLTSWLQSKHELGSKVTVLFEDVTRENKAKEMARAEREEWRERCRRLYHKVQVWREEKVKVQQAEAEEAARQQALAEERRRAEELRQGRERERERGRIQQYHAHLQAHRQSELEELRMLEEAAKVERKIQSKHNNERVKYRHGRLQDKMEELKELRAESERVERERERRLEQLRAQVQVEVSTDPERVLQDTVATHARATAHTEPEFTLQRPLYQLHSYPSDRITSDPRVRLEAALREAGLHTTMYARRVLSRVPPPQKPRPDQSSSLFKD